MKLEKLIICVEEPSMEAALEHLLPSLLGEETEFEILQFHCKDNLLKQLPSRLGAYAKWLPESWAILVLVDRDDDDCLALKQKLESMATAAGLKSKSKAGSVQPFQIANRIAIEELEAWFFGDWQAVQSAYPRIPATIPSQARYRDPDAIAGGTWEALERILKQSGYFKTGLRKLELARSVAAHMDPARNQSRSFQAFLGAVISAKQRSA